MEGKYLITTDAWFIAPDGKSYNSVWGNIEIVNDSILGIKTNARSTNWFAKIGSEEKYVIVAGCQIHYAVKCESKPNTDDVEDWNVDASNYLEFKRPTKIYIAE